MKERDGILNPTLILNILHIYNQPVMLKTIRETIGILGIKKYENKECLKVHLIHSLNGLKKKGYVDFTIPKTRNRKYFLTEEGLSLLADSEVRELIVKEVLGKIA